METLKKVLDPVGLVSSEKVVVVTGADKGIGYATVKGILRQEPNWTVYLTSRDRTRGELAVKRLHDDISLTAKYHELDIDSLDSIRRFRDHIKANHKNGIHLLINNAGNMPNVGECPSSSSSSSSSSSESLSESEKTGHMEKEVKEAGTESGASKKEEEIAKEEREKEESEKMKKEEEVRFKFNCDGIKSTIQNNYFSTLHVCQELFPLLGDNSSVIFVGTRMAQLCFAKTREDKQLQLRSCQKIDDVSGLMEQLMNVGPERLYSRDESDKEAWLNTSPDQDLIPNYKLGDVYYWAMAKLGLAVICRLYQLQFDNEKESQNVHLVTCCPGLVKTDLNPKGVRTPEEGADTIIWSALQPKDSPIRGVVAADRKPLDPYVLPSGVQIF